MANFKNLSCLVKIVFTLIVLGNPIAYFSKVHTLNGLENILHILKLISKVTRVLGIVAKKIFNVYHFGLQLAEG